MTNHTVIEHQPVAWVDLPVEPQGLPDAVSELRPPGRILTAEREGEDIHVFGLKPIEKTA